MSSTDFNITVYSTEVPVEMGQLQDSGVITANGQWIGVPGSFLEIRIVPTGKLDPDEYSWKYTYGADKAMGTVDLELFSPGPRPIFDFTLMPDDRDPGVVVADLSLPHRGIITVRWSNATPPAPPRPPLKGNFPYGQGPAWMSDPTLPRPEVKKPAENIVSWLDELREEGWPEDELKEMVGEEYYTPPKYEDPDKAVWDMLDGPDDSYTPKSARPKTKNSDPDRWDEDEEL